jgi:hypothetical protein
VYGDKNRLVISNEVETLVSKDTDRYESFCASEDGKKFFFVRDQKLIMTEGLDAPREVLGDYLGTTSHEFGRPEPLRERFVAFADGKTKLWNCADGSSRTVTADKLGKFDYEGISVGGLNIVMDADDAKFCFSNRPGQTAFERISGPCRVRRRKDSNRFELQAKGRCVYQFNLDDGSVHACSDKELGSMWPWREYIDHGSDRFVTPEMRSALTRGTLVKLQGNDPVDIRVGDNNLNLGCVPLSATLPLYGCEVNGTFAASRLMPDGTANLELSWKLVEGTERDFVDVWFDNSGSTALPFPCNGKRDGVFCVRDNVGQWRDVAVPSRLRADFLRTSRGRIVPHPAGALFAVVEQQSEVTDATVTSPKLVTGLRIYRFGSDESVALDPLPAWVWSQLRDREVAATNYWTPEGTLRVWPLKYTDEQTGAERYCGAELDGTPKVSVYCNEGKVSSKSRFGMRERRPGVLDETLDAGRSWQDVALPRNAPTDDLLCSATGCFFGAYYRSGWGR